jgi:hypothetical protein
MVLVLEAQPESSQTRGVSGLIPIDLSVLKGGLGIPLSLQDKYGHWYGPDTPCLATFQSRSATSPTSCLNWIRETKETSSRKHVSTS